ncbi:MAG: PqqD family protein [Kiritimatiellia bacterium]
MKYQQKKDVVARSVAGANLLVPVHGCTRSVYTLNETGCQLWELIATPKTEKELCDALVEEYDVPHETARHDVRAFLDDMVRMSLAEEQK